MKSISIIIGVLFFCNLILPSTRVQSMPGLVNPDELQVFGDKLFVGQFPHISIYSTRDFRLLNKIGKQGEGPKEFLQYCIPFVVKDKLIVSSQGKVSFFTLDGEFIAEKKVNARGASFKPVGEFYGVYAYAKQDQIDYRAIDLYDADFKKVKELYRFRLWLQDGGPQKGAYVIDSSRFRFKAMEHNLIWADMKDFIVYIWDAKSDQVKTIKQKYKPIRITEKDKKEYHQHLNKPRNRRYYERIKPLIKFPSYFPPIKGAEVADNKIYVYTYNMKNNLTKFFIFSISGKLIKKTYLLLLGGIRPEQYPFCFGNDQLFQLTEPEDSDEWALHITDIN